MSTLTTNYLAPSGREEAWRFTPLARVGGLLDPEVALEGVLSVELSSGDGAVKISQRSASEIRPISNSDDLATIRVRNAVNEVTHIEVAKNAQISEPIILTRKGLKGSPQASRMLISCGENSHATIILQNSGTAILAEDIEFDVAQGATLTFV